MSQALVVLLLGSNLGDTDHNIKEALKFIEQDVGEIITKSELLYSEPVEYDSNNIFCNIAVRIQTSFSPYSLLIMLKDIENKMGRTTDTAVIGEYNDRIIDIDIVKYNDLNLKSDKLTIPHFKHINQRDFSQKLISQL